MDWLHNAFRWFSGGSEAQYHTLQRCMGGQTFWVVITVALDLAVFAGYLVIAGHWARNERTLPPSPARRALADVRHIFVFCGICGYLFNPVKLVWPAWRLYDGFMIALVFFTWRYAFNVKGLKVLYSAVGRGDQLAGELSAARVQTERADRLLTAVDDGLREPLDRLLEQVGRAEYQASSLRRRAAAGGGDDDIAAAELGQSLAEANAAARLASGLLRRLIDYARVDAGGADALSITAVPLADVVTDALAAYRHVATTKGLELSTAVPPGLVVRTDRQRLSRVLERVVDNAVRFTSHGGVRVEAHAAATGVEVHVTDTGVGIPAEQLEHAFDALNRVSTADGDRKPGSGLGLSTARRVARQLGGDLTATSTVGRGSRFTIILPDAVVIGNATGSADSDAAAVSSAPQPAVTPTTAAAS